ncbi:cation:proton antiporter family protein [Gephyromycinifex aptenodytis]|uniref:cation:proton antiporter family protein n=1 Tax=Gephyromycinifex aptenodytis TaxID=2716227 RepID=UPI0014465E60|nr:cation:proton antiporter family protein [Gephyromycinifex aptenodytis]
MQTAAVILSVTFALGYLASRLRLPPLVGFLAAGFVLNALGLQQVPVVDVLADLGVTLLLFGIGLKLDIRSLLGKEVWLTATLHMFASVAIAMGLLAALSWTGIALLAGTSAGTWAVLGLALSFSSTVFVVKVLQERGQSHSFYGRLAIGILVIQDIVAVVFLTGSSGTLPSPWAFALVLLWPGARLFRRVWGRLGHGEMQSLFGILMALVPGYLLFDLVGLKGDLGALVVGLLLASHPSSSELSRALFHFKELLLVGFFVSIGLAGGLPSGEDVRLALALLLLLPIKAALYAVLLWLMRVRHRTSLLTAFSLMQFSEFALIVVAVGAGAGLVEQRWLLVVSVALSLSFVASAVVNALGQRFIERLAARAPRQDPARLHPEDRPADISGAEVIVLGMGRVGRSAYDRLVGEYGMKVTGVDTDSTRVERLSEEGRCVVEGDASDAEFWNRLIGRDTVRFAVVAMPRHGANLSAVRALREGGFTGPIAAVARYNDEVAQALTDGADAAFNVYTGAGLELADQVMLHKR